MKWKTAQQWEGMDNGDSSIVRIDFMPFVKSEYVSYFKKHSNLNNNLLRSTKLSGVIPNLWMVDCLFS